MVQNDIVQGYRLSPQQRHLWSLQQDDPLSRYRVYGVVSVEGRIDLPLLKQTLEDVCQRHEILRTSFHCWPGMTIPIQTINDQSMISIRDYDLSGLEPHEQPASIQSLVQEVKHASLDFAAGPLGHLSLVILSPSKCLLIISLSALCADVAGIRWLVQEISKLYEAKLAGAEPADEPLQYADVSAWQNELFESDEADSGTEYWNQQDLSSRLILKLPLEKQREIQSHFEPASLRHAVSRELSEKIRICADKYRATEALVFLACWQVLLARLTGQAEIVTGVSYTGRNYPELEGTVGPLTRCLPLAGQMDRNKSFTQVLADLKDVDDEAQKWQECFSWEQFVEANESLAGSPFLPYSFDFAGAPELYRTADLTFTILEESSCDDRYRVKIVCLREREDLITEFQFDSDLFSFDQVRRLADQYQTLLESAVQNPETAISDLEILPCGERQQLLIEFNQTEAPYPQHKSFAQLFEEQVEKTPDSVALVFGNQSLTYKVLNARANQLARHLRRHGVGPETVVGICLNRCVEMVIGVLGILKAGGAYLPLDPNDPEERIGFVLKNAQANIVTTLNHLSDRLPAAAELLCLDRDWESIARESVENLLPGSTPETLAYVIYTSGSTGKPKGVMLSHRGLVNYLSWCGRSYVTPFGQGAPVHSSLGFDLTVTSLFAPLLLGQTVFLVVESQGIEALSGAFKNGNEFSLIKITPSHLELLEQSLTAKAAAQIGALIIGGEALFAESLHFWRTHAPHIRIINEYGPTEAVVGCCVYELPLNFDGAGAVPIGQPIANAQLYVLDDRLQPVPVGVSGELFIGGAGLARGYLNQPDLTAEKFIPHPFSSSHGERLYRTGDLARHLSDGQIEYQGRLDEQVKLRGYRIELDEIRATLKEHSAVQDSVVLLREDTPGDKRLVAYVVLHKDDAPETIHWREFLKTKLPDYMIPSAFIMLDELPLTVNGKVARNALPASGGAKTRAEAGRRFVAPRNAVEEQLSEIWQAELHLESISMDDRFLELGGHSLLALRLLSRINQQFNSNLSLEALLQAETIGEMAQLLNPAIEQAAPWSPLVQLQTAAAGETELPFFCVHPATGSPFAYMELARQLKRQFYGLRSRVVEPLTSIAAMAAHYLEAVRAVQPNGPYLLGGWSMGGLVAYEMAVQLQAQGATVGLVALMDRAALIEPPRSEAELRELFEAVVANVKEQVRASESVTQFNSEEYRQYWQVFVNNYRATEAYQAPRYEGRVVLLSSEESKEFAADETLGWDSLAAEVEVHHVPGSHNSMILAPHVEVVGELLRDCIEQATRPATLDNEYEFNQTASIH